MAPARAEGSAVPVAAVPFAAVVVALVFAVLAVFAGLRTGETSHDIDEIVYQRTLQEMREGKGYYPATRDALVAKEGAPPSQVRSVRPPTLFLVLARFPEQWWRWVVAAPMAATILLSCRLVSLWDRRAALPAAVMVGLWMAGAAPLTFLHAELWGLPFAMAGLVCLLRGRSNRAAWCFVAASCIRELYLVWFLLALVVHRRRRVWWIATGVIVAVAGVHAHLAGQILVAGGREPPLNGTFHHLSTLLSALSPADTALGWALGLAGDAAGLAAIVLLLRRHRQRANVVLIGAATTALLVLTVVAGREYWGLTWGPVLAALSPLAFLTPWTGHDADGPLQSMFA